MGAAVPARIQLKGEKTHHSILTNDSEACLSGLQQ
jgi:hypothetical protein